MTPPKRKYESYTPLRAPTQNSSRFRRTSLHTVFTELQFWTKMLRQTQVFAKNALLSHFLPPPCMYVCMFHVLLNISPSAHPGTKDALPSPFIQPLSVTLKACQFTLYFSNDSLIDCGIHSWNIEHATTTTTGKHDWCSIHRNINQLFDPRFLPSSA